MRSKNRNFKLVAAGALLCITTCTISPMPTHAANGWDIDLKDYAYDLSESSISISIGGANSEILNADKGVAQGMIKQTASVELGATNGYTVKVSGAPNLTGVSTKATIPSAALTLGNMVNQWGWYAVNGVADCSESSVYKTMSTDGTQIDSGVLADGGTKTYTMCFGMRVNGEQAADTYSGSVTVSVVAEPGMIKAAPFSGITYMQDMTANICKLADENETAQLIDRRDNKKYWVTKMLDGNCWMSQNLDLNITTSNITTATSDVTTDWTASSTYPAEATISGMPTAGDYGITSRHSADLGEYVLNTPTAVVACTNNSTGLSACSAQGFVNVDGWTASADPNFYKVTTYKGSDGATNCTKSANSAVNANASGSCRVYDAHYLVGVYYEWTAATAGTGGAVSSGKASGSICPKGWRLPDGSPAGGGSYYELLAKYGVNSTASGTSNNGYQYNIALSPLFLTRNGYISYATKELRGVGKEGIFWTSDSVDSNTARHLSIDEDSVSPEYAATRAAWDGSEDRWFATPIRCVAAKS